MEQDGRWITTKTGNRVFIKNTNAYMNDFIRRSVLTKNKQSDNVEAIHITKKENEQNIREKGFDFEKIGSGAGNTFGKGIYFTTGENERMFYQNRLDSTTEIKSNIDTKGFLKVELNDYTSRKSGSSNAWDQVAKNLKESEIKQYKQNIKEIKSRNSMIESGQTQGQYSFDVRQDALIPILEKNYPGLIIKQNTSQIDIITGGNQIVVYDLSRIKIK